MKFRQILTGITLMMLVSVNSYSQDRRTLETRVADLLARMPAEDTEHISKLMSDMDSLGENGRKLICDQIIPHGTGDDSPARFAVESYSRYLSDGDNKTDRAGWERMCIGYAKESPDIMVRDFFMKQLQLIGGTETIQSLESLLADKDLCDPALAAIVSAGGPAAESALAKSLGNKALPCAAAVMNVLASMKSAIAVNEYTEWATDGNPDTRAAAYRALAHSGSNLAYPVLLKAANDAGWKWEETGAVAALLGFAENAGRKGDVKTMNKICKKVIAMCTDKATIQNKSAAMKIYTEYNGITVAKDIFKAAAHPDKAYRNAVMRASMEIPGDEIVRRWIGYFPKAIPDAKPEILSFLGERGNDLALPLISESLSNADMAVRIEAAAALSKIAGSRAVPELIEYMRKNSGKGDQEAAKKSLMTISGDKEISLLKPVLADEHPSASVTVIELMAWNKNPVYFAEILTHTASANEDVKTAAYRALADLASPADLQGLAELMSVTDKEQYVEDVQKALTVAALKIDDPEDRSAGILRALKDGADKHKLIPVLAGTGGEEALNYVLKEFEAGDAQMRDICFKTLTSWRDHIASSALYEIVASRNKTFEGPAFQGYLKQISSSDLPDDQKLLLYRKIIPFASDSDRKNQILAETAKLKTYLSLFFAGEYLSDPSTSAAAARAVMQIALPSVNASDGMYGILVSEILTKAIAGLSGPESDYEKEMINRYLASMPADEGFIPMFNGRDLTGWQGLVENPIARAKMRKSELARKQAEADVKVPASWSVKDGCIWFNGKGDNLCSVKEYSDFELLVDWRITKGGDSGIYLRGSPQVQIWDPSRKDSGASVGSGGLYNNQIHPSKPLKVADNPVGDWNTFRILMVGEKVSVWLNGELVVDDVVMENYWDRNIPIFPSGPIELQAHGTDLGFRNIYIREISSDEYNLTTEERSEGFIALFNGRNLDNWTGNKESYVVEDGVVVVKPGSGSGGNLFTEKEYSDFIFRFEFLLTPGANNGLGIRAPLEGDAAYTGMELQILDNTAPVYASLQPYQYHGSVYGVIPARRGFLNPVGEWNYQEVYVKGTKIRITLNGTVILDGDIADARDGGAMDHNDHPGLKNEKGHIGFLGHGSVVKFRNIRIKEI